MLEQGALTKRLIGLAIDVHEIVGHEIVGPGLLESVYQECLCLELTDAGIPFQSQAMVPVIYKGRTIPLEFRADIIVADAVIVEIKAVIVLVPAHEAQILIYLRMSHIRVGLLLNFHARRLKDGLRRFII